MNPSSSFQMELLSRLGLVLGCFGLSFSNVMSVAAQESVPSLSVSLPSADQRSPAVAFKISLLPTKDDPTIVRLSVEATIADGWHIYPLKESELHIPTEIKFEPTGLNPIDEAFKLHGKPEDSETLAGEFSWYRDYRIADKEKPFSGSGSVRFQACDCRANQEVEPCERVIEKTKPLRFLPQRL